jgi:holin-like protein
MLHTKQRTVTQLCGMPMLRQFAAIAAQIALLWFISRAGHEIVALIHLPLPGNVAGMLLTFAALSSGVLPLRFVEQGAGLLVRNLPLFFVPLAVGFVTQGQLLAAHGFAIVATLIGSAFVGFAVTGRVAQLVTSLQGKAAIAIRSNHVETRLDRR